MSCRVDPPVTVIILREHFHRTDTATCSANISGTANLTHAGSGLLILTGNNSYFGTTSATAGPLQVGDGGASGSLGNGNVTVNSTLTFNRTGDLNVTARLLGNASVVHSGTGTTTFSASNSYAGNTTVNAGTLLAKSTAALPGYATPGKVSVHGGATLAVNADPGMWDGALINGLLQITDFQTDSNVGIEVTGANSFSYAQNLAATRITKGLVKLGDGSLALSVSNTYMGPTTVRAGSLEIVGGIDPAGTTLIDVQGGSATLKTVDVSKTDLDVSTSATGAFVIGDGNHALRNISGSGTTTVSGGASLTADSIVQNTLSIGAGGTVTIRETTGGSVSAVPEPGTWVLIGTALLGWLAFRRRHPR